MKPALALLALLSLAIVATAQAADPVPQPPNILIVFTDDQGYADLGCFGS